MGQNTEFGHCEDCRKITEVYIGVGKGVGVGWLCTQCLNVYLDQHDYRLICDKACVQRAGDLFLADRLKGLLSAWLHLDS